VCLLQEYTECAIHLLKSEFHIVISKITLLQKIGQVPLDMIKKYLNFLVSDLNNEVDIYDILKEFNSECIKMNKYINKVEDVISSTLLLIS
jgi:hypothetical protein